MFSLKKNNAGKTSLLKMKMLKERLFLSNCLVLVLEKANVIYLRTVKIKRNTEVNFVK